MKTNITATAPQPSASSSFRLYLQADLARRCSKNPQYSLRSFALHLDVDHSTLSQLLRGRRPLTAKTIEKIGQRLQLDGDAITGYVAREKLFASAGTATLTEVQQLTHDTVNLISDWYHYAILELVRLQEFRPDTRWIARVLGISPDEVNVALQRLIHLNLLEMADRDRWIDKSGDTTASINDFTHVAIQRLSEQVHKLSLTAVREVPAGYQDHSSTTIAINSTRLPAAIERIARFRRQLVECLALDKERDDVYQLEISLFPLTNLFRRKENKDGTTGDKMADSCSEPR